MMMMMMMMKMMMMISNLMMLIQFSLWVNPVLNINIIIIVLRKNIF